MRAHATPKISIIAKTGSIVTCMNKSTKYLNTPSFMSKVFKKPNKYDQAMIDDVIEMRKVLALKPADVVAKREEATATTGSPDKAQVPTMNNRTARSFSGKVLLQLYVVRTLLL